MNNDRDALKQQIKDANDIVDVVGERIALRPAGPTHKGLCPFHSDHRPSFDVDLLARQCSFAVGQAGGLECQDGKDRK